VSIDRSPGDGDGAGSGTGDGSDTSLLILKEVVVLTVSKALSLVEASASLWVLRTVEKVVKCRHSLGVGVEVDEMKSVEVTLSGHPV